MLKQRTNLSPTLVLFACFWQIAACAVTVNGKPMASPANEPARAADANRFCAANSPPGTKCEDFTGVAEGQVPQGWLFGGGLMVQASADLPGLRVLAGFEPRDQYKITAPWKFEGDYRVEWMLKGHPKCENGQVKLEIGGVTVTIKDDPYSPAVILNETEKSLKLTHDYHLGALSKKGNVYKLFLDQREVIMARYEDNQSPEGITVEAGEGCGGFALAGLRVETPSPLTAPAAAPQTAASRVVATADAAVVEAPAPARAAPPEAAETASVAVTYEFGSAPLEFTFVVDDREARGSFVAEPPPEGSGNKLTTFVVPAGRMVWAAFGSPQERSPCQGGGDPPIAEVALAPGGSYALRCWQSNHMGMCCSHD